MARITSTSRNKRRIRSGVAGTIITVVCALVVYTLVVQGLRNPIADDAHSYSATFSDVSGLTVNSDVRERGVRIGKVTGISVESDPSGKASAKVELSVKSDVVLTGRSKLAIKFQSLAGLRYVDATLTERPPSPPATAITIGQTAPTFDITRLFNGLEPVLRDASAEDVNALAQNLLSFLQGDKSSTDSLFAGLEKLARYATSREQVMNTIIDNLGSVAGPLSGKASGLVDLLKAWDAALTKIQPSLSSYSLIAQYGPTVLRDVNRLINAIGLVPGLSIDRLLDRVFGTADVLEKTLKSIPPLLAGLPAIRAQESRGPCTHGQAILPGPVEVLLNGQEVQVCRPH